MASTVADFLLNYSHDYSLDAQQHRSLKALRKLLIAFRAAVHMNEEDQVLAWNISSSSGTHLLAALRFRPSAIKHMTQMEYCSLQQSSDVDTEIYSGCP